jgi:uncharacterized protein (DUF433 family)/DNA-binding transcriptional MerR regulator
MTVAVDNLAASASGCYGAARAAALSGVPKSTVYQWARSGLIVPSVSPTREMLWSFQDLLTLRATYWLRQRKGDVPASPMREVRAALEQTVQQGLDPWNDDGVRICFDLAGRVFLRREATTSNVFGQETLESADVIDLLDSFGDRPGLVRPTDHVRIAPARLVGEPHLVNTRVSTLSLVALVKDGYGTAEVANLYDLPSDQVDEAVEYEWKLAA